MEHVFHCENGQKKTTTKFEGVPIHLIITGSSLKKETFFSVISCVFCYTNWYIPVIID